MYQTLSKIAYNKEIAPGHFKIALSAPLIAKKAKPGQFVHVLIGGDTLLRRPFSIHSVSCSRSAVSGIEILYKVVGRGTELLSKKKSGESLDIIGPLGNGFKLPVTPRLRSGQASYGLRVTNVLIAGGMGVAPLVFLAEKLSNPKAHSPTCPERKRGKPTALIGARDKNSLVCVNEFKKLGCDVKIATDDGSAGHKGFVSELLKKELTAHPSTLLGTSSSQPTALYACGPNPMLKEIARICKENKIDCQVSLEEKMACGVGACLGCAVMTKDGYKMACKDGPVFNAEEIIW